MTALRRLASSRLGGSGFAFGTFFVLAIAFYLGSQLSLAHIAFTPAPHSWPDNRWLDPFTRWDTGWYYAIAERGYYYDGPGRQSAVAFFPAYPSAMRVLGGVIGNTIVAGVAITLACGAAVAILFHRWTAAFLGRRAARLALLLFLTYPFAFYLFGTVYSDALFLAAVLGSFSLLERRMPVAAGLVGIVATAARPVGVALVVGLVIRALEIRGVLPGSRPPAFVETSDHESAERSRVALVPRRFDLKRLRLADLGVLASVAGTAAFSALLWARFGDPFAFTKVGSAAGWYKAINLQTLGKIHFFRLLASYGLNLETFWLIAQGLFAVASLALVPAVIRRFGWGYGAYVVVAVGLAFASTPEFIGMGRYVLAGFPSFAAGADLLLGRPSTRPGAGKWIAAGALAVNAALLAWMTTLFATWHFLS